MRIDGSSNISAAARTNMADLLARLDTGDVIKAKVLARTSDEVVLRLFDGSVLKAAAGEGLEAKVGQTLTLAVTSRTEGTLFLETVKDPAQISNITPDVLKNMLEALHIKPTVQNMELAAEFIKAGISATADQLDKAAALMAAIKGLNAEKAAFMVSKGLQTDALNLQLLTKLLDGDLKLGGQLKELLTSLSSMNKTTGQSAGKDMPAPVILDAVETPLASNSSSSPNIVAKTPQQAAALHSTAAEGKASAAFNKTDFSSNLPAALIADTAADENALINNTPARRQETAGTLPANAGASPSEAPAASTAAAIKEPLPAGADRPESMAGTTDRAAGGATLDTDGEKNIPKEGHPPLTDRASKSSGQPDHLTSVLTSVLQDEGTDVSGKTDSTAADPFSKLKDAVKELFVNVHSDELASELDVNKLNKALSNKLDMLKAAVQTPNLAAPAGREGISAATALLDDSVKLLNQLNSHGMLYYQIPVHLSGHSTTVELYIMNRRQNKKRIDPRNTVMFISLDTNHLGRVETLIEVKDKNVSLNLRTEKQQINDFVKENIKHLYSGLDDCGYKLVDIKYALIDTAATPGKLEQLISKAMASTHSKVDMRI